MDLDRPFIHHRSIFPRLTAAVCALAGMGLISGKLQIDEDSLWGLPFVIVFLWQLLASFVAFWEWHDERERLDRQKFHRDNPDQDYDQ